MATTSLQFVPFSSSVHPAFWSQICKLKLEKLGLDEAPLPVTGAYANNGPKGLKTANLSLDWDALNEQSSQQDSPFTFQASGTVLNKNTLEVRATFI